MDEDVAFFSRYPELSAILTVWVESQPNCSKSLQRGILLIGSSVNPFYANL